MIKRAAVVAIAGAIASPAIAQNEATPPPTVEVIGIGTVKPPPDIARLSFDIRGEGTTADKATQALVDRQKDVVDALTGLLGSAPIAIHTSGMKIEASRSPDCKGDDDYSDQPRLSTGPCAILGYVAGVSIDVRTKDIKDAGTAVGLAGRLGADNASIEGFDLEDKDAARREAAAKALADANDQAEAITKGSGADLGPLLSVRNQAADAEAMDVVVTASRAAPPVVSAPPIVVTTLPQPIETTVRLVVTYAIRPKR